MKRIFAVLLAILLCVPVCFPAFADMGGPEFSRYTVTLRADTTYFDTKYNDSTRETYVVRVGTIPAGTVLTISDEYEVDGEMYGYFYDVRVAGSTVSGYVRVRDVKAEVPASFPRTSGYRQSIPVRLRVTAPNGVIVYAGPSASYAQVTVIPQGTELTVDTLDQAGYESGAWMYVTYGGKSGWTRCWLYEGTNCPMAELLLNGGTGTLWVVKDGAVLTDKNWNHVINVPKGERLTFNAFNRAPHTLAFYVTYQGKSGIIRFSDDGDNAVACNIAQWDLQNIPVKKSHSTQFYADPDMKQLIGTVNYQAGETIRGEYLYYAEIPGEYGGEAMIYTQIDGQYGWIKLSYDGTDYWETKSPFISRLDLSEPSKPVETTTAAPVKTTVPPTTTTVPSSPSAASTSATDPQSAYASPASPDPDITYAQTPFETEFVPAEETTEAAAVVSGRVLPPGAVILLCVTAAIVLALTAVVTLMLIRRKKEN